MSVPAAVPAYGSLEPTAVWSFFGEIAAIPRPSKDEERIRAYIHRVARKYGLSAREDDVGNIVVAVPASPGFERAPTTVLQGHLDMVPEKNTGSSHDFAKDPIRFIVDREGGAGEVIVRADGTTLGADNGIGVAMSLAAATSPDVTRGPLELLFTTDEEDGMTGAKALSAASFTGRRLLNLDSEEDDALYIGCAGGCDTVLTWDFDVKELRSDGETVRVAVTGLRGGHSGSDIHENRGNAIKLLASALCGPDVPTLQLVSINGGSKRNAIPREASAVVSGPAGVLESLRRSASHVCVEAAAESNEPELEIDVQPVALGEGATARATLTPQNTECLLAALTALPHGVLGQHREIPGLVETSNNVATVSSTLSQDQTLLRVVVANLTRSSSAGWMQTALSQIAAVGRLARATIHNANEYPGWSPDVNSDILATCREVYLNLFGESPKVEAIHAGLECGIIGQRVGDMDMVSFGPRIVGCHSPDERVYVASVQKSWRYLLAVLAKLASG